MELPDSIYKEITRLSALGNEAVDVGNYEEAIKLFHTALELLPNPADIWEAATWLYVAIGESQFFMGKFEKARASLMAATHCPGGTGNPFTHLRLGQVEFELGNEKSAVDELMRAYMDAGWKIFSQEDPKYFDYLTTIHDPPPSGWDIKEE